MKKEDLISLIGKEIYDHIGELISIDDSIYIGESIIEALKNAGIVIDVDSEDDILIPWTKKK